MNKYTEWSSATVSAFALILVWLLSMLIVNISQDQKIQLLEQKVAAWEDGSYVQEVRRSLGIKQ